MEAGLKTAAKKGATAQDTHVHTPRRAGLPILEGGRREERRGGLQQLSPLPLVVPLPLPKGPLRPRALIKRTKEKKGIFGISKKKTSS